MIRKYAIILALLSSLSACQSLPTRSKAKEPIIILNQDNSNFFFTHTKEEMTVQGLQEFVDQYADSKITHLFFCPNAMRTNYDSAVWDAIWDLQEQRPPAEKSLQERWMNNAKHLSDQGIDPYEIWIARCRETGISPWLSMRMNDVHDANNPKHHYHSTFWRDHPEFRRAPELKGPWENQALDYLHPEVRAYAFSLIEELLERYDPDGIELDWMRFPYHFAPTREAEGRLILTQFMRDVRALADSWALKRGHPIRIGARVPSHPGAAFGLGMDGVAWVQEGLIDLLAPAPFWTSSDLHMEIDLWRAHLGSPAPHFIFAPALEINTRPYPGAAASKNDLAIVRGFAATALHEGADGIYLFNYLNRHAMADGPEAYQSLLENGLGNAESCAKLRRYCISFRDTTPPGLSSQVRLPASTSNRPVFSFNVGPMGKAGAQIWLGVQGEAAQAEESLELRLNGLLCTYTETVTPPAKIPDSTRILAFSAPATALRSGKNLVSVGQRGGNAAHRITWLELRLLPAI